MSLSRYGLYGCIPHLSQVQISGPEPGAGAQRPLSCSVTPSVVVRGLVSSVIVLVIRRAVAQLVVLAHIPFSSRWHMDSSSSSASILARRSLRARLKSQLFSQTA